MSTMADPGKIQQVIFNLAINARDAMPDGGDLIIGTSNIDVDQSFVEYRPEMNPGNYVVLSVGYRNGCGHARIFELFFTTKPMGKGTGLGLATVYGIVRQSGGQIWVYSEPGQGTTFKIYLPAVGLRPEHLQESAALSSTGGHETVLVAEDEPDLREVICEILSAAGYKVLVADGATQAIAIAEQQTSDIDLLITDMVMPGTPGPEMATKLAARFPNMKSIFMSGYSADAFKKEMGAPDYYLEKPFSPHQLIHVVRRVLDAPKTAIGNRH